jgi:SSS family solute:Na+ symporter
LVVVAGIIADHKDFNRLSRYSKTGLLDRLKGFFMGAIEIIGAASLGRVDWIMIAGYFAVLFGIAWWVITKRKDTADDYFLAGRNLGWFVIGASIFASNIGSEHLVGLAGSGATDGVAMAHYELHAWCLLVLGWIMVPFYAR